MKAERHDHAGNEIAAAYSEPAADGGKNIDEIGIKGAMPTPPGLPGHNSAHIKYIRFFATLSYLSPWGLSMKFVDRPLPLLELQV
jgi:hypothetical protein